MTRSTEALRAAIRRRLAAFAERRVVRRLWDGDPTVWTDDPHTPELADRLGWLTVGPLMAGQAQSIQQFGEEVRAGYDRVVLLGMGGSSLAPEVLWRVFGRRTGFPVFQMLDSTHPHAVRAVADGGDLERTLFIVASKSGTTVETASFFEYFWALTGGDGRRFVAITDPGTVLERIGRERGFRRVFLSLPDIGGRYSALSPFGLVPAALMGIDVAGLLERAETMAAKCGADVAEADNPGCSLGVLMAEAALAGRDKLSFVLSPRVATFGLWAEQLIAESTGKAGKGILPVVSEPAAARPRYCDDRIFVGLSVEGDRFEALDDRLHAAEAAGHPCGKLTLADPYDLGAEFFRWEFATAVAGAVLRINPFDQPNVAESKENTKRVLAEAGRVPPPSEPRRSRVVSFLDGVKKGDYVCVQAFMPPSDETDAKLADLCAALRDRVDAVVTMGYGPRYLHSTGQLHKGGPTTGHFMQIVAPVTRDETIPGAGYSFGQLLMAQAQGDQEALTARGRPVVRVADPAELLEVM